MTRIESGNDDQSDARGKKRNPVRRVWGRVSYRGLEELVIVLAGASDDVALGLRLLHAGSDGDAGESGLGGKGGHFAGLCG